LKFTTNNIRVSFNESGQQEITYTLLQKTDISEQKAIIANGKLLEIDSHQQKKKRSLDANSYFWVLVDKIAGVLRTSQDELYIEMLTRYGQKEKQLVSIIDDEEAIQMLRRATKNHCCEVGEGEANGRAFKHFAILRGSSGYDTREMSILIDGIVSECKDLDIEVMTPNQLAELKSSWKGK
jgi:hypothetical protein